MKKIFQLALLLLPLGLLAQEKGVGFDHTSSWTEILAKAKAENKFIFMDCFTTWCGPCKYMSANIFPQEKVGEFFNKNFVSVKVQMDQTPGDNENVKKWYDDAKAIAAQYGIAAYPTFLYFSPDGKLVHRVVGGGEADVFIAKSANALNPATQYHTLLDKFKSSTKKEPAQIRAMALAAQEAYDQKNSSLFANEYLATQKDLMTKENIEFISKFTSSSKDKGFAIFLNQGAKVDAVAGPGTAARKIKEIITREEIYPMMPQTKDAKPDWTAMKAAISKKYPAYGDEVVSGMQLQYLQSKKDWTGFQENVAIYMKKYGKNVNPEMLNSFAWNVFENCPDMKCVGDALEWSKTSFKDNQNPAFIDTYANILYKMGKNDEAIAWEEKALKLSNGEKTYQETIDKMKKGEKTWNN